LAGSKKGEHRGNARKRTLEEDLRLEREPSPNHGVRHKHSQEYLHEVVRFVHSDDDMLSMLPRDAIQEAQDFFRREAHEAIGYYNWLRTLTGNDMTKEESEELESRMFSTKREIRSLIVEMSNQAFKNLPYFHAKASADDNEDVNPMDIVRQILREIDDATRGRPTWMKPDLKLVSSS
jgi:hypothetical protein